MKSRFDGRWLERGPPSLPPGHPGGLHLPRVQAGGQTRQVAHLPRGCRSTRRERKKKKRAFHLFIILGFSSKGSFPRYHQHKTARTCTPRCSSLDHSQLSFSKAGQTPCQAHFSPLAVSTVEGAGSGGGVSVADVS